MATNKPPKNQTANQNIIETLTGLAGDVVDGLAHDVLRPQDIYNQLVDLPKSENSKKYSGDLQPGSKLEMRDIFSGKRDKEDQLKKQLNAERVLHQQELVISEKKINELRLRLNAIIQEVTIIASSTQGLATEVKTAAFQVPTEASVYHVSFFEKLLEVLISFRKKIDSAAAWLAGINKRSQKKNYWSMYKKSGTSFLLSPEQYSQHSTG